MKGVCSLPDCDRPHNAQGLCLRHYMQALRSGQISRKAKVPLEQRFWAKVEKSESCWLWTATLSTSGYGQFHVPGDGLVAAHRYAWELENGPIADGMVACHTCDVRACVRPSHIFLGTQADNVADMYAKGREGRPWRDRDACKHGHPLTPQNTYVYRRNGYICRACRTCRATQKSTGSIRVRAGDGAVRNVRAGGAG